MQQKWIDCPVTGTMKHIKLLPCTLYLFSTNTYAGTADPGGVAELIFTLIVVVPLIILITLGYICARWRGIATGLTIYLIGFYIIKNNAMQNHKKHSSEIIQEREAYNDACFNEAGESGQPLPSQPHTALVFIDPNIKNFWYSLRFDEIPASPSAEYVESFPKSVQSNQILISINLINRLVKNTENRRVYGFETTIMDSNKKVLARRLNIIKTSFSCLDEGNESIAIERFLRHITGQNQLLISSQLDLRDNVLVKYPLAEVSEPEDGVFELSQTIKREISNARFPSNWGCLTEKGAAGYEGLKCQNLDKTLDAVFNLQRAWLVHDTGDSWLAIIDPQSSGKSPGYGSHSFGNIFHLGSDKLIIEERTRDGQIIRRWVVRSPVRSAKIKPYVRSEYASGYAIGDIKTSPEYLEITWLFKGEKDTFSNGAYQRYAGRYHMKIPMN